MSTRARIVSAAASLGILGAGWAIGTLGSADATQSGGAGTSAPNESTAPSASATTSRPTTAKTTSATSKPVTSVTSATWKDGTYTGNTTRNQFGSWVVTVTIKGGKITDISHTTTANDSQSARINASAVPTLKSRVIAAQSSDVNLISGATLTCNTYLDSLQSALDKAVVA